MASENDVQLHKLSPRPIEAIEPLPARDALRGNLKVSDTGADSILKKRKSWFGSMRDVFHKGALQAKAAVDSMRGEQVKYEDETKQMIDTARCPYQKSHTPEHRTSVDSAASTAPLRSHVSSPQLSRRRTFSPKQAVSSFRQHLHGHGSRSKCGSVYSVAERLSTDVSAFGSPEHFMTPAAFAGAEAEPHRRKNSVASSLVGSIRGLTRRPTKTKTSVTTTVPVAMAPDKIAEEVPLPSSPINIPSVAPVLGLDLGQPGMDFLSTELPGGAEDTRKQDNLKLQDPANFAIGGAGWPSASLPHVSGEVKMEYTHPGVRQRPATPREMLFRLPAESVPSSPFEQSATPLPGTNQRMHVGGADDSASSGKKSQVFERSVTPSNEKERKELRTMCSLDAIADARSTACENSHAQGTWAGQAIDEQPRQLPSPEPAASPSTNPFSSPTTVPSISTIETCPLDMPQLERQKSVDSKYYKFGFDAEAKRVWTATRAPVDDPFDDSHAAISRPPSPAKSLDLPFRLKIESASEESRALGSATLVGDHGACAPDAQYAFLNPTEPSAASPEQNLDMQQRLQHKYAVAQDLFHIEQTLQSPVSPVHAESMSDDTITRAQNLWNSDVVYPGLQYPDYDEGSGDGLSPHGGPMVPAALWHRDASPSNSPGKSTWKAGLGDGGYRFSLDTWLPGPQPLPEPQPLPTPQRRSMNVSLDSVSADEKLATPLGSRTSTKSDRTPSMGNKLELDLKRSERNTRYNALNQEHERQREQQTSSSPIRMQARFILGGSSGDMDANEAQYFPDYSTAYAGSQEDTPKKGGHPPTRVASEDSMTKSLRSASDNMEKLRVLLGDIDSDGENQSQGTVDAFTTASSPRSKHPRGRKSGVIGSVSPSSEDHTSRPLPSTPTIGPYRFSPASARDNDSPNRFSALEVEVDVYGNVSSPEEGSDTVADLPLTYDPSAKENRPASGDTLDQTLDMLSSPDSGYKADESSDVQTPKTVKELPKRYRSQSNRRARTALGRISGNST